MKLNNKFNTLFKVINVYLDLCLESIDSKSLINACTACPFREFKDEALTCASLKLTEKVFEVIPFITKSKRKINNENSTYFNESTAHH